MEAVTMNVTEQVVPSRQTTRPGDRRPLAADPEADAGKDSEVPKPQTVECPVPVPQEMVQEIVSDDDHEEETLQSDAETAKKVMINEASTLPSVVTTGKAQRGFILEHDHGRSVARRVSGEKVSDEDGCLSRNMTIKAHNEIEAELLDYQCVILHVRLTPETKDSTEKELLMKMPKSDTLINAARPERVHELEVLSAMTDVCYLSDVRARDNTDLKTCDEQSVVIMNTPEQNVNAVAEVVFDMMLHSEFEVTGRSIELHTIPL